MARPKSSAGSSGRSTYASPAEIAPGVFVGSWHDAAGFSGHRFCVLDEVSSGIPPATHIPIYDPDGDRALVGNLDRLAEEVRTARGRGEPVLLFCGQGVRRAPLAGAWYLHRAERVPLAEAYRRVRSVRPQIETAGEWIGHPEDLDAVSAP
jgi:hypothetical protein